MSGWDREATLLNWRDKTFTRTCAGVLEQKQTKKIRLLIAELKDK